MESKTPHELLKALDDHIRTIHLTLMALALLLLPAILVAPPNTYEKPISDLKAIIRLKEASQGAERAIKKEIDKRVVTVIARDPGKFQNGRPVYISVQTTQKTMAYAINSDSAWAYKQDERSSSVLGFLDFDFRSLAKFISFWDRNTSLLNIVVFESIESRHVVESSLSDASGKLKGPLQVHVLTPQEVSDLGDRRTAFEAGSESLWIRARDSKVTLGYSDRDEKVGFSFEVVPDYATPRISLQELLRNQAKQEDNWLLGEFGKAFSELHRVTAGVTQMPLMDVLAFLKLKAREEQERKGEQLDVFGAKIPADKLGVCGIGLLIGVQGYFLLHIRRLREIVGGCPRIRSHIVWIGGCRDKWAQMFVVLSALVLPLGILVCLAMKVWNIGGAWANTFVCLSVVGSSGIGAATLFGLTAVWRVKTEDNPCAAG